MRGGVQVAGEHAEQSLGAVLVATGVLERGERVLEARGLRALRDGVDLGEQERDAGLEGFGEQGGLRLVPGRHAAVGPAPGREQRILVGGLPEARDLCDRLRVGVVGGLHPRCIGVLGFRGWESARRRAARGAQHEGERDGGGSTRHGGRNHATAREPCQAS